MYMCISIYLSIYSYTCIFMYMCISIYLSIYSYTCTCACVSIHLSIYFIHYYTCTCTMYIVSLLLIIHYYTCTCSLTLPVWTTWIFYSTIRVTMAIIMTDLISTIWIFTYLIIIEIIISSNWKIFKRILIFRRNERSSWSRSIRGTKLYRTVNIQRHISITVRESVEILRSIITNFK